MGGFEQGRAAKDAYGGVEVICMDSGNQTTRVLVLALDSIEYGLAGIQSKGRNELATHLALHLFIWVNIQANNRRGARDDGCRSGGDSLAIEMAHFAARRFRGYVIPLTHILQACHVIEGVSRPDIEAQINKQFQVINIRKARCCIALHSGEGSFADHNPHAAAQHETSIVDVPTLKYARYRHPYLEDAAHHVASVKCQVGAWDRYGYRFRDKRSRRLDSHRLTYEIENEPHVCSPVVHRD